MAALSLSSFTFDVRMEPHSQLMHIRISSDLAVLLEDVNLTAYDLEPVILEMLDLLEELQLKYPYLTVDSDALQNLTILLEDIQTGALGVSWPSWHDLTGTHKFNVFSFTLTSSVDDFWQAKAYPLALIIAIWSGAWPYIKLLLLLVIWLHPMKGPLRKKALVILDQLGKFSFIDLYVMIFMAVSFYITINFEWHGVGIDMAIKVRCNCCSLFTSIYPLIEIHSTNLILIVSCQSTYKLGGD